MFSSSSFIVSGLTFKSFIHFKLIFVNGVMYGSSFFFCMWLVVIQFSQNHSFKETIFSPNKSSLLHCQILVDCICVFLLLGFQFCSTGWLYVYLHAIYYTIV